MGLLNSTINTLLNYSPVDQNLFYTYWHLWHIYLPRPWALILALHSWQTARPPLLTKPRSASSTLQISQRKQAGCQFWFIALITLPIINSPHLAQQGANNTWKSCSQYLRPSNSKNVSSLNTWKHCAQLKNKYIKGSCHLELVQVTF